MTVELLLRLIDLVQVALDRFGSGWVWLYYSLKSQMLVVDSTPNQVGAY
jgi:superoxide dismutase